MDKFGRHHINEYKDEGTIYGYINELELENDTSQENKEIIHLMFKDVRNETTPEEKVMLHVDQLLGYHGYNVPYSDLESVSKTIVDSL